MKSSNMTSALINRRNEDFWAVQRQKFAAQLADERLRNIAFEELQSERVRTVPIRLQRTLEGALEWAAKLSAPFNPQRLKQEALIEQARKGGRAGKADALQRIILGVVRRNPRITEIELRVKLTRENYPEIIEDVDQEGISFKRRSDSMEPLKNATLRGLKDRLSRAKKIVARTG
jgi:hypothetical protein